MSIAILAAADRARPYSGHVDRSFEIRRLNKNLSTMIAAHPKIGDFGRDDVVENLADQHGFGPFDLVIRRVVVGQRVRTIVAVPERVSRHAQSREQLITLKHAAAAAGHPVVIVRERFVQRQPRLSNLRLIEAATQLSVSAEHRIAVLVHLIENPRSTILECASAISHEAPVSLILHLAAEGLLSVRTDQPLGPGTYVDIAEASDA